MAQAPPIALSRLSSVTDLVNLRTIPTHSLPDHRHKERFRHKRILDALSTQTRHGIPIQRSLAKLEAEANKILHDRIHLTDDETQIFLAFFVECQLRICLESELDLSGTLYWDCLFWQDRISRPLEAWLEAGPFSWFQDPDEVMTPEDKLEYLQRVMVQINVGAGLVQQHLSRKLVNTDVQYLGEWTAEALALIDDILSDDFESPGRLEMRTSARQLLPASAQPGFVSSVVALKECMARLTTLRTRISTRAACFHKVTSHLRAPSFLRRRWLHILVAAPFLFFSLRWVWGKRGDIPRWVAQAVRSTREFFLEHVSEPSRAIAKELIWNEHESITDMAALEDAKESLARMLADFVRDTNPKLPEEERRALAANMDMSVVSSRYEQSLPQAMRHIINGEIVRMLLIQVQFIKKELLVAMRGIDDVMNSNNLNFRLMAIFPAVLAMYGTYQGTKAVTYKLTRRKGRGETIMLLRSFLLSMERMLNLRNVGASENEIKYLKLNRPAAFHANSFSLGGSVGQSDTQHQQAPSVFSPTPVAGEGARKGSRMPLESIRQRSTESIDDGHSSDYDHMAEEETPGKGEGEAGDSHRGSLPMPETTRQEEVPFVSRASTLGDLERGTFNAEPRVVFLKPEDLGVLLLLIHQFAQVVQRTSRRFLTDLELRNLQEDLNEIIGNCGPVTVAQQLCVVQRMHRSYRFLQAPTGSLFSSL